MKYVLVGISPDEPVVIVLELPPFTSTVVLDPGLLSVSATEDPASNGCPVTEDIPISPPAA